MKIKIALLLLFTMLLTLIGSTSAQAAPGRIYICNHSPGNSSLKIDLESNSTGANYGAYLYSWTDPQCGGENTGFHSYSEPEQYRTDAGWCSVFQVNGGPWSSTIRGGSYGAWQWIHPGEGYASTWNVDVREWNC